MAGMCDQQRGFGTIITDQRTAVVFHKSFKYFHRLIKNWEFTSGFLKAFHEASLISDHMVDPSTDSITHLMLVVALGTFKTIVQNNVTLECERNREDSDMCHFVLRFGEL